MELIGLPTSVPSSVTLTFELNILHFWQSHSVFLYDMFFYNICSKSEDRWPHTCTEGDMGMELWLLLHLYFLKPVCLVLPGPSSGTDRSSQLQSKLSLPSSSSLPAAAFPLATFLSPRLVKNFCMLVLNLIQTQTKYEISSREFESLLLSKAAIIWS